MTRKPFILVCCLLWILTGRLQAQTITPDFSATPTSGCGPLLVQFADLSTGNPTSWAWDFGNGTQSHLKDPSITFSTPGSYTITLIVANKSDHEAIRKTNYVTVYPYPSVQFTSNLTLACAPGIIQFQDLSTPGQGTINSWNWTFGDGGTGNTQNPQHTYSQTGYYTVGLKASNSQGCANSISRFQYIRVVQGVQSNFTWSQSSNSCSAPFQLNFTNQTAGPGTLSYNWTLGNGATSTLANPSATYPANTSYTVILNTQSSLGCSDTSERIITFPAANAVITSSDSACANTPVNFRNGSIPVPRSSLWTFGDGNTSTAANPSNSYAAVASYSVKLINTYASCVDSVTKTIAIINSPTANFTSAKTTSCKAPFTATFQDASTPGVVKWQWDFGDGSTSAQTPPVSHTYTQTGSFDIKLTVTNSTGCSNTITIPKFIQVLAPSLSLKNPQEEGCVNTGNFQPQDSAFAVDGVSSYLWNSGGGSPATSISPTPDFTYATAGDYNITLTVTTNDGCSVTTTFNNAAIVGNPTPAAFTVNSNNVCRSSAVTFTSTSSPADEWIWNFGDGVIVETDTPIIHHFYKNEGFRQIMLTVIDHGCATSITTPNNYLYVNPPIAKFSFTTNCLNTHQVAFNDNSALDPTQPATYIWDFGDGSSPYRTTIPAGGPPGSPPPHIYPMLISYPVTLTVTNGMCTDITVQTITLDSLTSSFTTPPTDCRNAPFTMTSTSSSPSLITDYSWTVGTNPPNNPVSSGTTPSFSSTPTVNGPLPLSLTITDINGCPYTSQPYSIQITGPTAKFDTTASGGCKNSPILFIDQSTNDGTATIDNWVFNFGDGTNAGFTPPTPPFTHQYSDTGYFNVQLSVQDTKNCVETYTLDSAAHITAPQAGFFAKDTFYCPNEPLPFTDSSKGIGLTWAWDFGDGSPVSNQQDPAHSFATSGQHYTIRLRITDEVGCSDSVTRNNYISIQSPIAAFTISDTTAICIPLQTNFTPNAQYYDSLYWDFGDGTTSTLPITTHFYNNYDTFYAKLFVQGAGGCLDSATRRVFLLNPYAVTSFTYSPLRNCDSVTTNFTIVPPGFTRFTLSFGDGKTDSTETTSVSHQYKNPDAYYPVLEMEDSTGCFVNLPGGNPVIVLGATPFFSADNHAFCDSATVNFADFTITNDPIISETLQFGDGATSTEPNGFTVSHAYSTPGTLLPTLVVNTVSNCAEDYTDTIRVYQTPHPVFTYATQLCASSPLLFQGDLTVPDVDSVEWAWSFGDGQTSSNQDPIIMYAHPGPYLVGLRAYLSFGCSDTTSQEILVHALPTANGPAVITTPVGIATILPFTYGGGLVSYTWTPAANLSCTDCPDPLASPIFNTEYTITVVDTNSCVFTDSVLVKTICNGKNYFLPNTFSPNGDGVNDVFYPRGDNLYNIQSMRIFNRWGQMVFERRDFPANSAAGGWDGTFNGHPAPVDVYAYIVEVVCDNAQVVAISGNVALVR